MGLVQMGKKILSPCLISQIYKGCWNQLLKQASSVTSDRQDFIYKSVQESCFPYGSQDFNAYKGISV